MEEDVRGLPPYILRHPVWNRGTFILGGWRRGFLVFQTRFGRCARMPRLRSYWRKAEVRTPAHVTYVPIQLPRPPSPFQKSRILSRNMGECSVKD
jgi:hypothetical protein